jgi:6-phosphogluconolactonase/glucosamine-6-phosphate isomerase/deaminase
MKDMIHALGIPDAHVLRVHTELPLEEAADRYDTALRHYLHKGGRIKLGLLGLGADGHTASLFSSQDVFLGQGRFAVAVKRPDGMGGVSVTRDLLLKAEQIVFLAFGAEKGEVVHKLVKNPGSLPAGMAVEDIRNVEVWYAT